MLSRYVDNEVTPRQRREVLDHVAICHDCAAYLARLRQADVLLKGVPETRPSDKVREAVLLSARKEGENERPAMHVTRQAAPALPSLNTGWRYFASDVLLRFDFSLQRVVVASAAAIVSIVGLAFWLGVLPPLGGYSDFGFSFPKEQEQPPISAPPIEAVTGGSRGIGGQVGIPSLQSLTPRDSAREVAPSEPLRIRFDQPMERASVESSLLIDPPAAGSFEWGADNELSFTPAGGGLLRGITYTVSISTSARSLAGTALTEPVSWSFRTREPYSVEAVHGAGTDLAPTSTLTLLFSTPMDPSGADGAVALHAPEGAIAAAYSWDVETMRLTLSPKVPLAPGEVTLRVGEGARTRTGETLGRSAEFTYTVALRVPRLRLLEGRIALAEAGEQTGTAYEAMAGEGVPLDIVSFSLYSLPGEQISTLGAGARPWPAALPDGLVEALVPVQSASPEATGRPANPEVATHDMGGLAQGTYLLVASAPSRVGTLSDWQMLVVANRDLATAGGALWATDEEGNAWRGAEISLYSEAGALLEKGLTDEAGVWAPARGDEAALAIARDLQGNVAAARPARGAPLGTRAITPPVLEATLLTDLPAYYPGEQVNFRALIHRQPGQEAQATPLAEQDVTVSLFDAAGARLAALTLKPDAMGGVTGLFGLASSIEPGEYILRVSLSGASRDFPLAVRARAGGELSVYISRGEVETGGADLITYTASILGPGGEPAMGAALTATLGIAGDSWASEPTVVAADASGKATFTVALPDWHSLYNDPGIYIDAQTSWRGYTGTKQVALDLTSPRRALGGIGELVSPAMNLAAIGQPEGDGATRLRLVALGLEAGGGDLLVQAVAPSGERRVWVIDLAAAGGDVTLPVRGFAGGAVYFSKAGVSGTRRLELPPGRDDNLRLTVDAPKSVAPGAALPVEVTLLDREGAGVEGSASIWMRRVSGQLGESEGAAEGWVPALRVEPTGTATAELVAPGSPGLWLVMGAATTGGGTYLRSWSVVEVLPGPNVQVPASQSVRAGDAQSVAVVVHNPADAPLSTGIRMEGGASIRALGNSSQPVDVEAGGSQRLSWRYLARAEGTTDLKFSFMPSAAIDGEWALPVEVAQSSRTQTTYASGVLTGQQTVGVQVPSGLSESDIQLEIRASNSLLSGLADSAGETWQGGAANDSVAAWAARLSAAPSVASAYSRLGVNVPSRVELSSMERSLALQQLYASQHEDGGWGASLDPLAGPSNATETANVLLAMRRQSLGWAEVGGEPQPAIESAVVSRGMAYLAWESTRPLGEEPSAGALDERARTLHALALYGTAKAEIIRPLMAYAVPGKLSQAGQGWLALALWQAGDTAGAVALLDRLLPVGRENVGIASPMLEVLTAAANTTWPGGSRSTASAAYETAAQEQVRSLMSARQGALWATPGLSGDALWALSRYAAQDRAKSYGVPSIKLDERTVQAAAQPGNPATLSAVLPGGALHAGTNWLKLQAPTGQPMYYSLTLRASR